MVIYHIMQKTKRSPEIDAKIIAMYLGGKDTYQVAEEYSCSQTFVVNTLKRHNIPRRPTHHYTTKYITNEKFFNTVDSEEKAYILGFLYADGNNYVRGTHSYEVSIALEEGDRSILDRIKNLLSPTSELKFIDYSHKNWKNQYLLKINSKTLTQQLTKLGCIPVKSLALTWPEWLIDPKLRQHFIRGYFDGDGSFYARKPDRNGRIDYGWQVTSTNDFCNEVKRHIENTVNIHCSINLTHPKTNQITTTLSVGGNLQVRKVLDWLYKDATIFLPRKYDKYQKFLNGENISAVSSNL